MIAEARRRAVGPNVAFLQGNGRDLSPLPSDGFDLALAIDVFPYLVATGLDVVESNLRECARVLQPQGRLLLFNYSYRGDDHADDAELASLAVQAGLIVVETARPFRLWDGRLFELRRGEVA